MIIMEKTQVSTPKEYENYTEWVHCNSCWSRITENGPNFHITQCGHVYCDKCIELAEKKCYQCGETGVLSLPIKEPLNPQIAHYFTHPEILRRKTEQAEVFKKSQTKLILARATIDINNKYQILKQQYMSIATDMKTLHHKYSKLKMISIALQNENKKLLSRIEGHKTNRNHIQYQTPPNAINQNSEYVCDNEFKVPTPRLRATTRKVPKSAGYYSASSGSNVSSFVDLTPKSTFSTPCYSST